MRSKEIRQAYLDFFNQKGHAIFPSAPMVVKDDPTLMFINAGMNQFKDIFLGNEKPQNKRIADSQKCMRVSGKHNDLEEVGRDTYHHTMFEMLGNWSFGDYFKAEAISWAWEFLIDKMGISQDRLYATVFEGDKENGLEWDSESMMHWKKYLDENSILYGSKKDNFWEMGDTGPCGPCSEIHIDLRNDKERAQKPGKDLVNKDHPMVIELWNLVFIQFNRKADGTLNKLPQQHVDTGMGFERLCLVMQNTYSNYDTDLFQPLIQKISGMAGKVYGEDHMTDVSMRVIADHLRAISFSIADGQMPSNVKAGYVIRRILRRAIRYGYTYLDFKKPFMHKLLPTLISIMGEAYPELNAQKTLIEKAIKEEEQAFLKTLDTGIKLLNELIDKTKASNQTIVSGKTVFELYDTYGFPLDLTQLILKEHNLSVDKQAFDRELGAQKTRSRQATKIETGDWIKLQEKENKGDFIGYDHTEAKVQITQYRKIKAKGKDLYQVVFNHTPFYAESGGQVGDTGYLAYDGEKIPIIDTKKEHNQTIHYTSKLPADPSVSFQAVVSSDKRKKTANNHTATHLLHHGLREVLGQHVEQKGSLVHPDYLRFDYSHFQKPGPQELKKIEKIVNYLIRRNLPREEKRAVPFEQAKAMGATALFGEKYGEKVRVVKFGDIIELCGGTHVDATGQIGIFVITTETAISAGIRRIEALTADKAEAYFKQKVQTLQEISEMFNNPADLKKSITKLIEENDKLSQQNEALLQDKVNSLKDRLMNEMEQINGINYLSEIIRIESAGAMKDMVFQLKNEVNNLILLLGANIKGKPNLFLMISENLVKQKDLNASDIIREAATEIKGGGGGQPFYATAGGKDAGKLSAALDKGTKLIMEKIR